MNIFPKKKITFRTSLTKDEVRERLARASGYEVGIYNNDFEMIRIIKYRNSFLPQIRGKMSDLNNSTEVDVSMKLHPAVVVFMMIWLAGVLFFCVIMLFNFSFENFDIFHLIPFLMFVFGLVMMNAPFGLECSKSEKDLKKILEAEIIE